MLKNTVQVFFSLLFSFYSMVTFAWISKPTVIASEGTGIAFIHGTGDHRDDAIGGYWQQDFIDSVRQGLPNPDNYVVTNCDFGQYMWMPGSAGCLADQLGEFIENKKIHDLIIITHSDGGNVIRWIMSNPSYDRRYPPIIDKIRWVDAVAPSSLGTPLADAAIDGEDFEWGLAWLLGYTTDSVRQQRVGDMAIYNRIVLYGTLGRPSLPKPFYPIVGTDVYASPFNSDTYCGGYSYNIALKVTKLYLDSCADGFLDCKSQAGAGSLWFFDTEQTKERPLSHNQSRNKCFGLDDILKRDI